MNRRSPFWKKPDSSLTLTGEQPSSTVVFFVASRLAPILDRLCRVVGPLHDLFPQNVLMTGVS
jgi:hypothetical protein